MALYVQKFGGTSVASPDRIAEVVDHVRRTVRRGDQVVLVVSAMGKETDELIRLAEMYGERNLLTRKEECERCGRMISHISRSSHWKSKRCQREHARRLREANPEAPENASEERDGHGVASPETCVVIRKPAQPMSLDAL